MEKSENMLSGRCVVDGPDGSKQLIDLETGEVLDREYPEVVE